MTECPALNTLSSNLDVVTSANENQLRLSTYTRTVGTEVTLSCINDYRLVGQDKVTCQANGSWNYGNKPYCEIPSEDTSGLSTGMKILIGALVGGILLVVLIFIIIACCFRHKKKKALSDNEKFYRHLQEEDMPKGKEPGVMVTETAYRQPSYAAAWPALSHSFMVGKREYPFREPEPEVPNSAIKLTGKSLWDGNDYFFERPDIPSGENSDRKTSNTETNNTRMIRFNDNESRSSKYRDDFKKEYESRSSNYRDDYKREVVPYRPHSMASEVDDSYHKFVHPISNRYSLQREISSAVKDNYRDNDYQYNRPVISTISGNDNRIIPSGNTKRELDDDVVVEVRIPSRYLKEQIYPESRPESRSTNRQELPAPYLGDFSQSRDIRPMTSRRSNDEPERAPSSNKSDDKPKDVYQGHWPVRDEIKNLNEFNKRALLHNRDPFLWRPVDTNFGFDSMLDTKY